MNECLVFQLNLIHNKEIIIKNVKNTTKVIGMKVNNSIKY